MVRFRDVLKNGDFLKLWIGQIVSNFGDAFNQMALIALVRRLTPGSAVELARLIFFIVIPVFIIGPVAGAYSDRWDKRRVMITADILRGCLVLLIPLFIFLFQSVWPIYILVFLIFSITRFFIPSKMGIIPEIVPKHMLLVANTLSDTTRITAVLAAYAIAGFIVESIGDIRSFYLNAASYFISAAFIFSISGTAARRFKGGFEHATEAIRAAIRRSIWSELVAGVKHLSDSENMRFIIKTWFLLMSAIGAVSCVMIVFIQESFATVTKHVSLLTVFFLVGLLSGVILYGKFCQHIDRKKAVTISSFLAGIMMAVFGSSISFNQDLRIAAVLMICIGASSGPIIPCLTTMVHESIAEDMRGRVFSSVEAVIHMGFLVFMFAAALLAEHIDGGWIIIATGVILAASAVNRFIHLRVK